MGESAGYVAIEFSWTIEGEGDTWMDGRRGKDGGGGKKKWKGRRRRETRMAAMERGKGDKGSRGMGKGDLDPCSSRKRTLTNPLKTVLDPDLPDGIVFCVQ